ncbi:MAG: hypothetical protein SFU87_09625 [Chitinophagaceae bacterium]|nr:hypothetical protein [Chitinophagaceae bacterium]
MTNRIVLIALIVSAFAIMGCSSSNKAVSYNEDKVFYEKLKKFKKKPHDELLKKEVVAFYEQAVKQHEDKIAAYRSGSELSRYDRIISEYNSLQWLGDLIRGSVANNLVKTINYYQVIQLTKEEAAAAYYNAGLDYLDKEEREDVKKAYNAFKKTGQYVSNYKDAARKMQEAYDRSIVNIVINPIRDNNLFFTNWNTSFRNDRLQESLVRDLGGQYASTVPARFYTDWEARRNNISADWVVDLSWNNLYVPQPSTNRYSRNVSKNIQTGTDTSGKPVYKTVYATLQVTRRFFNANGEMEYRITETGSGKNIGWNRLNADYNWQEEYASYTGDSRALDSADWALINNTNYRMPNREDIVEEMFRRIYPDLRNRIRNEADW